MDYSFHIEKIDNGYFVQFYIIDKIENGVSHQYPKGEMVEFVTHKDALNYIEKQMNRISLDEYNKKIHNLA